MNTVQSIPEMHMIQCKIIMIPVCINVMYSKNNSSCLLCKHTNTNSKYILKYSVKKYLQIDEAEMHSNSHTVNTHIPSESLPFNL